METSHDIELTPEQKGVLASLAEETGESVASLIDKVLDELQERVRASRVHQKEMPKPMWERIRDGFATVPKEEMETLPTDGSTQVDHYVYGVPKR
jgi:hypothetical protein